MPFLLLSRRPSEQDLENYMHYFVRCNAPEDTREKFKLVRRQEGGERVGRETGRERRERKRERIRGEREGGGEGRG